MADVRRLGAAAFERFVHRGGRQLRQRHVFQRATEGSDGGACCADDIDLTSHHGHLLE